MAPSAGVREAQSPDSAGTPSLMGPGLLGGLRSHELGTEQGRTASLRLHRYLFDGARSYKRLNSNPAVVGSPLGQDSHERVRSPESWSSTTSSNSHERLTAAADSASGQRTYKRRLTSKRPLASAS
jgi:hypothetical protein